VSSKSLVKSSVQRGIRVKILEQYPMLEDIADELLPKKLPMYLVKWYFSKWDCILSCVSALIPN
jgi:hypothetical protein